MTSDKLKVKSEGIIDFKLYLITDRKQLLKTRNSKLETRNLLTAVKEALKGGVKAIQLREKDLGTRELLNLAYKMRELTKKYNAKLFINDRVDVALAVNADGVHLTQNSIPAYAVRKAVNLSPAMLNLKRQIPPHPPLTKGGWGDFYSSRFLIGVSTHSLKEAKEAEKAGTDFITLGPIFETPSKLQYGLPLGVNTLKRVAKIVKIPVFAIGGVKKKDIDELNKSGAFGIAMISEVFGSSDIQRKTKEIMRSL